MKIQVSGGIVTYNNIDEIEKCLKSILEYTKDCNFKLYVFDNHSTDGTPEFIREHFPEAILMESDQNMGFGAAHNEILKRTESRYHAVINPDIFMDTDALSQMADYLEEHREGEERVVVVTPEIRNLDGSVQYLPKRDPNFKYIFLSKIKPFSYFRRQYTRADEMMVKPTRVLFCTGCFFMIRTDLMKKLGGFDDQFFMYFEDADLSRRARRYGQMIYHPGIYVYHAWKRDNMHSIKGNRIFLTSMKKYYKKYRSQ